MQYSISSYEVLSDHDIHSESESTLEILSTVAPSVEYITNNMVPTKEAIPEEGG